MGTNSSAKDQYRPASWRGTLPKDPETGEIKISFNLPDGQILRMKLDEENAKRFFESMQEYLYLDTISQKDRSSGILSLAGSIPEEGR